MDRLFDGFFNGNANGSRPLAATFLPLSVWEDEKQVYIEAEAPGVKLDDIELIFHDGTLRIAYSRSAPEGERNYWVNERGYGRFERVVRLPDLVDENAIKAELNAGVLYVAIGKKPELQPRKIAVQVAQSQPAIENQAEAKE
jgi:HSP20 family protein